MSDLTILWGHPVPYSFTVQHQGCTLARIRPEQQAWVQAELTAAKPGAVITRIEGGYVYHTCAWDDLDVRQQEDYASHLRDILGYGDRFLLQPDEEAAIAAATPEQLAEAMRRTLHHS